jgi:hypothetical protein
MNFSGIIIGAAAFLIIGLLHPVIIKAEYHVGKKVWPVFGVAGLAALFLSLNFANIFTSSILGVLGFSLLWSIQEVIQQEKRVKRGWFPKNPKKSI